MTCQDRSIDGRRTQLFKGLAELALLSLLAEGPCYGVQILEALRRDAGLALAEGTIYPLLHRLERSKLAQSEWRLEGEGNRPRKYYSLAEQGHAELVQQLADWQRIRSSLDAFLERPRK